MLKYSQPTTLLLLLYLVLWLVENWEVLETNLVTAYQIFRATETLPNREILLDSVNRIFATVGYDQMNLSVVEQPINLESIKGANTEDV